MIGLAQGASAYVQVELQISCTPTSPFVNEEFTCTATGFDEGTVVTFTISPASGASVFAILPAQDADSKTATSSGGSATVTFTRDTPGLYTVTASGTANGSPATVSTTITVQAAGAADGAAAAPADGGLAPIPFS